MSALWRRVGSGNEAGALRRRHYQVGVATAIRWTARAKRTGSPAALPMGGKKPFRLAAQGDWIRARLAAKPDITGRELLAELCERKVEVSWLRCVAFPRSRRPQL